jgi:histidine triad (HIT) family protein
MGGKDCIFCKIIGGKEKSWVIYEDDATVAFLDAFPVTEGHVIVAFRKHVEDVFALNDEEFINMVRVARKVAKAMKKVLKVDFVNMITAQSVIKHAFIHVVPRYDYDLMGVVPDMENKRAMSKKEMDELQKKLKGGLGAGKKA